MSVSSRNHVLKLGDVNKIFVFLFFLWLNSPKWSAVGRKNEVVGGVGDG